jgi:signal transduction histidine kinase
MGAGQCLVRAIVNARGGRIELQSDIGEGSSFTIHLANH